MKLVKLQALRSWRFHCKSQSISKYAKKGASGYSGGGGDSSATPFLQSLAVLDVSSACFQKREPLSGTPCRRSSEIIDRLLAFYPFSHPAGSNRGHEYQLLEGHNVPRRLIVRAGGYQPDHHIDSAGCR